MADATVTGQIHVIEPTKSFGQKGFRKRTIVLEQTNGRFTNYLPIDFLSDACDDVDALQVGDKVTVSYRLTGRKWQRDENSEVKYFLSAEATKFEVLEAAGPDDEHDDDEPVSGPDDETAPF